MSARDGLKVGFGSVVVYVVVAACAGGSPDPSGASAAGPGSSGGGADGSGSPVAAPANDDSGGRTFLDALVDPVPSAKADANQSGSRLKAKYYVGKDGSKQFFGWHDSMLDVDCSFVGAADETTRCLPVGVGVGTSVAAVFSDAACSRPVILVAKGCFPTGYVDQFVTAPPPACAVSFHRIFRSGDPYVGALYTGTPASCSAAPEAGPDSPTAGSDIFALGAEVPQGTFVVAVVQTDP
jgi:hypothetical protein